MKNQFSLEINKPCSEKFNQFTTTELGGFCNSCEKEVIDFSKMTSQEVIYYFKKNNTKNTCGQFKKQQLTTYAPKSQLKRKYNLIKAFGFALLSFFSFSTANAQKGNSSTKKNNINIKNHQGKITVKGNVSDETGDLPGVNILLQGTSIGAETDFDGNFTFPKALKEGDVLIFSFVGMESKKVTIQDTRSAANINLKVNMKNDSCMLLGKVAVKKVYSSKNK
ncbi:carboxypeptidase-like regulatory domain-containing protein [Tenacibaculum ovolyticum]|uniref:carboxypeptidase-like regulatory domain-containing protein n=1 Tax=Tenacibaculum ovolyticum TaxID=104270 RepID=UPI0009EDECCC|nr:carboxypeptidase-like regulatory domain-containing protein [Tenacibaculum ovolyticum]